MTKQEFEEMTYFKLLGKDQMLVGEFISYWTETSLKGKKMRFESEKFFDINRRFATFEKNAKQWNKNPATFTQSVIDKTSQLEQLFKEMDNGNSETKRLN